MPPYELPKHQTRSGIKTRSSLQGTPENFNEIRFEDKKGAEELHVQAERNLTVQVKASESRCVGGNRSTLIEGSEQIEVHGKEGMSIAVLPGQLILYAKQNMILGTDGPAKIDPAKSLLISSDVGNIY